jgi:hypothetical protein
MIGLFFRSFFEDFQNNHFLVAQRGLAEP